MKIIVNILTASLVLTAAARAEFGVSAGASFNYKAGFRNRSDFQGFVNDAGAASAGVDHVYDDGYNRVDSSGNDSNLTSYWGYDNASQDNGGSVTMSSSQNILDAGTFSGEQTEGQPAIEIYYQREITTNESWNVGLRAAARWQRVNLDSSTAAGTTVETISDTYSYTGILPGPGFEGSSAGPNFLLSDDPSRSTTCTPGTSVRASRDLEADLFALDLGPTLSFNFTDRLRLSASVAATVAWINSEFSYTDRSFAQGSDRKQAWLFGATASADLSYLLGEHWGLFGGAAMTRLQDFDQQADGRSASLEFDDSCSLRFGLFFR